MAKRQRKPKYEPKCAEGDSELVDAVMREMERHFNEGDLTSIDEMLRYVPRKILIGFLPEELWPDFK